MALNFAPHQSPKLFLFYKCLMYIWKFTLPVGLFYLLFYQWLYVELKFRTYKMTIKNGNMCENTDVKYSRADKENRLYTKLISGL